MLYTVLKLIEINLTLPLKCWIKGMCTVPGCESLILIDSLGLYNFLYILGMFLLAMSSTAPEGSDWGHQGIKKRQMHRHTEKLGLGRLGCLMEKPQHPRNSM